MNDQTETFQIPTTQHLAALQLGICAKGSFTPDSSHTDVGRALLDGPLSDLSVLVQIPKVRELLLWLDDRQGIVPDPSEPWREALAAR